MARKGAHAVAQFNLNGFEWVKAALETAKSSNSAIILGVTEQAAAYMCGYSSIAAMVREMDRSLKLEQPIILHADHCSFAAAELAIKSGFTSVMYDGSHCHINENCLNTRKIVQLAAMYGVSTEAEAGGVGGEEDGISGRGEIASPEDCKMLADCGIDALAAGIGNIHGLYPDNWQGLDFEALEKINSATNSMPLALHGGSGIEEKMLKESILRGVSKINVNTECKIAFCRAVGKAAEKNYSSPQKLYETGIAAIKEIMMEKLRLFGGMGKA